ncbi:DUF3800 domain-containing protein [Sinorhizobium medicae]|nr:DUF3800 domain-containing protein [Sinorhizobium medicae]
MHLMYCDETNLQKRAGDFLIYGGLIVEGAAAKDFSVAIDEIRLQHGVPRDYRLKFNPGPDGFGQEQFIALKQDIITVAGGFGAKLLVYAILHDIAVDPDTARRNGINTVCYHFDCVLNRVGGTGLVLIDRFNDEGNRVDAHLRDKFTIGLTGMPYAAEMRLPNIVGFHYSAIGQSHFPSVIDVLLGSLRFAMNTHTQNNERFRGTAHRLLELLSPLIWRTADREAVPEIGFMFSPKAIRLDRYREKYVSLKAFLGEGGIELSQEITAERRY